MISDGALLNIILRITSTHSTYYYHYFFPFSLLNMLIEMCQKSAWGQVRSARAAPTKSREKLQHLAHVPVPRADFYSAKVTSWTRASRRRNTPHITGGTSRALPVVSLGLFGSWRTPTVRVKWIRVKRKAHSSSPSAEMISAVWKANGVKNPSWILTCRSCRTRLFEPRHLYKHWDPIH